MTRLRTALAVIAVGLGVADALPVQVRATIKGKKGDRTSTSRASTASSRTSSTAATR
jgi:hypothetical protein